MNIRPTKPCTLVVVKHKEKKRNSLPYQGRKLREGCTGIIRLSGLNRFNILGFRPSGLIQITGKSRDTLQQAYYTDTHRNTSHC
ncbi:MAG: hypothetical protein P8179_23015 [Candidatus Thiodiazotropha sp.]